MYRIGHDALGQRIVSTATVQEVSYQFDWQLRLYYKDGGFKKAWWVGQDDTPIRSIKFELNKHICGAGTIDFVFLDFPIDADDYIELYYQGDLKYRALVDVTIDPKGGQVKLVPYSIRFAELLFTRTFVNQTIKQILKSTIDNTESDTGITWNADFVDITDVDTFNKDYTGFETPKKIIDENVGTLDEKEYGVTPLNIFTVYQGSTTVDKTLFYGDDPAYASIEYKEDLRQVKATEYQVLKKVSGSGETKRLGYVGQGGSYPEVDIATQVRKKQTKYTVSEVVASDSEALDVAYANLKAQAVAPVVIKVKELRVDKYFPVIGERLTVQDSPEYVRYVIIHCDSLTNDDESLSKIGHWTGATLETSDFVQGSASVKFTSGTMKYSFDQAMKINGDEKLGFEIKGTVAGQYITVKTYSPPTPQPWGLGSWGLGAWGAGTETTEKTQIISIGTSEVWEFKQLDMTGITEISKVEFSFNDATVSTVKIDRIELFGQHREEYTANVVQANFIITSEGTKCDMTLNDYDVFANDEDFRNQRKIEKLEAISQTT
jgi:hypothetical protein